tara:strand:- start:108 stop:1232 length:1125 start_codon:yes stop_codon:yes gene_type:complete
MSSDLILKLLLILILILVAIGIGFSILYFKKNSSKKPTEENIDENNELDARSKLFLKNAVGELLKNNQSSIFQILKEQKEAYDDFNTKKGAIDTSIENVNQQTMNLVSILTNNASRGEFGELTVEALLDGAGLIEGTHYEMQDLTEEKNKPDFTFYLQNNMKVNMDSKFPLDGFKRIAELQKELVKPDANETHKENIKKTIKTEEKDFLNKIRDTIQSTAKKSGYVDTEQNTIPYMILYIPVENIFQMLLNSQVPSSKQPFIEYAASQKVMLAGPATLLMQLEIIKQSQSEFALIQKTSEIADMNKEFYKEVNKFVEAIGKVYDNLEKTRESFKDLQNTRLDKVNLRYKDLKESIDKSSDSPIDSVIDDMSAKE